MINPARWLQLSADTRAKLKVALNIPKSGGVMVSNDGGGISTIISDGHTAQDLYEGITLQKLQEYLGSAEKDLIKLFEEAVDKIEGKIQPIVETPKEQNVQKRKTKASK